jgi:hypothetical protein
MIYQRNTPIVQAFIDLFAIILIAYGSYSRHDLGWLPTSFLGFSNFLHQQLA